MDFTLPCPAPREKVCDSGQREAAGSNSGSVTDRAWPLLGPCTQLTQKGPLSEALGKLEWPVGGPRGLPTGVPGPPDPGSAQCATPGWAPAAAASAADAVGHQASQSRPPLLEALRSVPLSLEASRAGTRNSSDPASAVCRRTSRSCCGTSRQHCLLGS